MAGPFSLMAGALSQGLGAANEGITKGLLGGEEIRHRRAGEEMQQEHLGLQRNQLTNQLAQQAYQNALAQQRLGLSREQLGLSREQLAQQAVQQQWQQRHGDVLRGIQEREVGLKEQQFPYDRDLTLAKTKYYGTGMGGGRAGTENERFKNGAAQRLGYDSYLDAPPAIQQQIDGMYNNFKPFGAERSQRYGDLHTRMARLNAMSDQALANPSIAGPERVRMNATMGRLRYLNGVLNRMNESQMFAMPFNEIGPDGRPWSQESVAAEIMRLEQDLAGLESRVGGRGVAVPGPSPAQPLAPPAPAGGAAPAPMDAAGIRSKWGLDGGAPGVKK